MKKKITYISIIILIILLTGMGILIYQTKGTTKDTDNQDMTAEEITDIAEKSMENLPGNMTIVEESNNTTDNLKEEAFAQAATYSDHAAAYNNEKTYEVPVMDSNERITYRPGFFYQPITEDVKERIYGLSYKEDCTVPYEDLRYLSVLYKDFQNETQVGEIVCNKAIAQDLVEIFFELYCNQYQIDKIRLVDEYNADDDLSCEANNSSCFNFRQVYGSNNLSKHALGLAIDINPMQNPYVTYPNGVIRISPPGSEPYADRTSGLAHMITEDDLCYKLFTEHGFTWGGHWKSLKDYQHFQKALD